MHRRCLPAVLVLLALAAGPAAADTFLAGVGWIRSDVGLQDEGDDFYLAVARDVDWGGPVWGVRLEVEYARKSGSQPTSFVDPVAGFVDADAEVTLHVLEPAVFLGATWPGLPVGLRLYAGPSIALKLKESWSDFPGVPPVAYGYKETDLVANVGVSVDVGPASLDLRWSKSMVGQLLIDPREVPLDMPAKIADGAQGFTPEDGYKTETWRVGLLARF